MLKYRINQSNILGDKDRLKVNDSFSADLSDDDRFYVDSQCIVMCYCDDLGRLQENSRVLVEHMIPEYSMTTDDRLVQKKYNYYTVKGINYESRMFSLTFNKFMYLPLLEIQTRFEEIVDENEEDGIENVKGDKYVYFYFNGNHLFDNPQDVNDGEEEYLPTDEDSDEDVDVDIIEEPDEDSEEEEEESQTEILNTIWLDYLDSNGARKFIKIDCLYENDSALKIKWDDLAANDSTNGLLDVLFIPDINGKINNIGNKNVVSIYRETLRFSLVDGFKVYYTNPKTSIQIALKNNTQIDLVKESLINDYINKTKRDVINDFIDGEKNICFPTVAILDENDEIKSHSDVVRIDFNLHFRKRSQENWISNANDYWNGVKRTVYGEKNSTVTRQELSLDMNYFSYPTGKEDEQSDLLTYAGFDYNDVKYQKNKVKKSFIRLSYYDSINPAKQNLLAYSTIFVDGGKLYGKLIKNINGSDYYILNTNNLRREVNGINVNTEYYVKGRDMSVDEIEEHRLSTQLSVSNPGISTSSSEGFYFYLWKDILDTMPEEGLKLYMKIEFHHAGYGRTVPFMMPFWDKNKHVGEGDEENKVEGIKTFREILSDYSTPKGDIIKGTNKKSDGPYEIKQYMKFSYICLRIKWDKNMRKYIYFLDNETYGNKSVAFSDNILRINLYEGMIAQ